MAFVVIGPLRLCNKVPKQFDRSGLCAKINYLERSPFHEIPRADINTLGKAICLVGAHTHPEWAA